MAQSTPTSNLGWQDFFSTTLSSGITSTDTTIPLVAAPTPTEGFLVIEPDSSTNREIIMYTSVSGSNVVCGSVNDRGISGTTARAHSSGVIVKMNTVADMFEALQSGNALSTGAIATADIADGAATDAKWRNAVAFKAYRNAAKSIGASLTDVVHDTELYDLGSNFNTTTGVFTAPAAGVYSFMTSLNGDATLTRQALSFVCSTAGNFVVYDATPTSSRQIFGGLEVNLVASETVKIQALNSSSFDVAGVETWFAGHLVTRT